jgi:anthranilate synthase component II
MVPASHVTSPFGGPGARVLVVDNVDSFTYNLVHALGAQGLVCEVVGHDEATAAEVAAQPWAGLVIGPGPCSPERAGLTLPLLERLTNELDARPVLGICLGHQALALVAGGRLRRARRAVHGDVVTLRHDGGGCLSELSERPRVVRYNSLVVDETDWPDSLVACAWDDDGDVMAVRHVELPHEGVQFHPESWRSVEGLPVLRHWARRVRRTCEPPDGRAG